MTLGFIRVEKRLLFPLFRIVGHGLVQAMSRRRGDRLPIAETLDRIDFDDWYLCGHRAAPVASDNRVVVEAFHLYGAHERSR